MNGLSKGAGAKQASLEYGVGDRVRHIKYGEGSVLRIVDGPRDYQVTVNFDGAGQDVYKRQLHRFDDILYEKTARNVHFLRKVPKGMNRRSR